ncbi:hypothetical protein [Methylotenera sp.]|uniref:hypothetical protein n=1 Tax=Methylotenera sp. TaxID=2051956 RepID=UPI0024886F0B|nr:hypothetical protein [Methylotenera sp.]MDI1360624.1 hypothetical protein [Methylotenera sp.]
MANNVRIIADSLTVGSDRLTTYELKYWRAVHAELMTHRVFSRNASSSRAIPVAKVLAQVWSDPAGPEYWGSNQAGMQAGAELSGISLVLAKSVWKWSGRAMCVAAWTMMKLGMHKQVANRLLEPWQYITVVLTSSKYDNWFELRDHADAQPEIASLARKMRLAREDSVPSILSVGDWHLPYVTSEERNNKLFKLMHLIKFSVARCARVSYLTHDKKVPDVLNDMVLYDRLVGAKPWHASPLEHQATPATKQFMCSNGNLSVGWTQYRKLFEEGIEA